MKNYFLSLCYRLGLPPTIWMMHNPMKIYEYLKVTRDAGIKPTDAILDLGCGQGIWTMDLARQSRKAVGVDISNGEIETARKYIRNSSLKSRMEFYSGRLETLDLPADSFDHFFSFCVLEHIDNLAQVLAEANRILRPGGGLHVSVDSLGTINDEAIRTKHQNDHFVIQYFTMDSLRAVLTAAGFKVNRMAPILAGEQARSEFQKRILGRSYHYGWLARQAWVRRLDEADRQTNADKGIMIVAHASRL